MRRAATGGRKEHDEEKDVGPLTVVVGGQAGDDGEAATLTPANSPIELPSVFRCSARPLSSGNSHSYGVTRFTDGKEAAPGRTPWDIGEKRPRISFCQLLAGAAAFDRAAPERFIAPLRHAGDAARRRLVGQS